MNTETDNSAVDTESSCDLDLAAIKKAVIGLTMEKANEIKEKLGVHKFRCTKRNGYNLMHTFNYIENRINVATENDVISDIISVG